MVCRSGAGRSRRRLAETVSCGVDAECGASYSAHDIQQNTWRHLNFFQYHCYVHASVLRVKCPEHGVKLAETRRGCAKAARLCYFSRRLH